MPRAKRRDRAFTGYGLLNEEGILLVASPRLHSPIRFSEMTSYRAEDFAEAQGLIFTVGIRVFCLSVDKDALPFTIVMGRAPAEKMDAEKLLSAVEEELGKRVIGLYLPTPSVSTFKRVNDQAQMGHAVLRLEAEKTSLQDLNSKNGTYALASDASTIGEIIHLDLMKNQSTVPVDSHYALRQLFDSMMEAGEVRTFSGPLVIGLSKLFRVAIL